MKWTKFEQNPLENKWFQFFISGTPDSRRTFFVLALTPPRVAKSTCLFYIHNWFWLQIFRISWKIDNLFTRTKVMAFQSWGKKFLEFQKSNAFFKWLDLISVKEFDPSFFIIWAKNLKFAIKFRFWHRYTRYIENAWKITQPPNEAFFLIINRLGLFMKNLLII